jgi:DNA-binding protein H-NS
MADHDPIDIPNPWPDDTAPAPLSRRERAAVLARIEALMEYWGITIDDLTAPTPAPETPTAPVGPLPVKYRHPVTGDTWDGQGPHPDWLRRALLQEGLRVDELRPAEALPPITPEAG